MNRVNIVIVTWDPKNQKFLDLCIESIQQLDYPKELIQVNIIARNGYLPQYEGCKTWAPEEDQFYPARAINHGFFVGSYFKPKYHLVLNDDVILTKDFLKNMVSIVGDNAFMANGLSPCDNGIAYQLAFKLGNDFLHPDIRSFEYEQLALRLQECIDSGSLYGPGLVKQPFLCIYATLIPQTLVEAVGDWDENFKVGQDDLDYSLRAHQKGFGTMSVLNALCWHFGGSTVKTTLNQTMRYENVLYFKAKWDFWPPGLPQEFIDQCMAYAKQKLSPQGLLASQREDSHLERALGRARPHSLVPQA